MRASLMRGRAASGFYACWGASSTGWRRFNRSGCKSANDSLFLETFGALSRRNSKSLADQDHCFAYISGKGPHLHRQTGVTEADGTVCPEQDSELILNARHLRPSRPRSETICACVTGYSTHAARVKSVRAL